MATKDTDRVQRVAGTDIRIVIKQDKTPIGGDIYHLPCLGGYDTSRESAGIWVRVIDGQLCHASSCDQLQLHRSGPIMGWGKLDCEWSWGCGLDINIPPAVIDHMAKHYHAAIREVTVEENCK